MGILLGGASGANRTPIESHVSGGIGVRVAQEDKRKVLFFCD